MSETVGPAGDYLRPVPDDLYSAWAARVRAHKEQSLRLSEIEEEADRYAGVASRFRSDPERANDQTLEILLSMAGRDDTWLDIGAGGGRYALPLALHAGHVHAVEPSPAMREILRSGMLEHGRGNISISGTAWPPTEIIEPVADMVLMAHVGSATEDIAAFLDAAEAAASRGCVLIAHARSSAGAVPRLWQEIHGEPRIALPGLAEFVSLLFSRGRLPAVDLVAREPVVEAAARSFIPQLRRTLRVRPGSAKDEQLGALVAIEAAEVAGGWVLDRSPSQVGVVTWSSQMT